MQKKCGIMKSGLDTMHLFLLDDLLKIIFISFFQACYFDRDDVALKGFVKRFRENSEEERGHAMKLMDYQNMRGGRVVLQDVCKPQVCFVCF